MPLGDGIDVDGRVIDQIKLTVGAAASDAMALGDLTPVRMTIPASITATSFTFEGSIDGGNTYVSIKDATNVAVSVTVGATAATYALDPVNFVGLTHMRLVPNAAQTGSEKTISISAYRV